MMMLKWYTSYLRHDHGFSNVERNLILISAGIGFTNFLYCGSRLIFMNKRWIYRFCTYERKLAAMTVLMIVTDIFLRTYGILRLISHNSSGLRMWGLIAVGFVLFYNFIYSLIEFKARFGLPCAPKHKRPTCNKIAIHFFLYCFTLPVTMIPHFLSVQPIYWLWEHI
eukprot:UN31464